MRAEPRARRTLLAVCVALVASCGARTGARDSDASEPVADVSVPFATFPCRWTLGRPLDVAQGVGLHALGGAVHARLPLAAIVARDGERGYGATATLDDPPVLRDVTPDRDRFGTVFGTDVGFLDVQGPAECTATFLGPDLAVLYPLPLLAGPACVTARRDLAWIELFDPATGELSGRALREGSDGPAVSHVPSDFQVAAFTWHPSFGWLAAGAHPSGELEAVRMPDAYSTERTIVGSAERRIVSFDADRLRPGIVLLLRAGDAWSVARVSLTDETPSLQTLHEFAAGRPVPLGTLVTNETEALVPLESGHIADVPLNGLTPSEIGPLGEGPPREVRVLLRTGRSEGGVAYIESERPSGGTWLRFRALVCNR